MVAKQELVPTTVPVEEIAPLLESLELEGFPQQSIKEVGHAAIANEIQDPEQPVEVLIGRYDHLTTPLSGDLDTLKRDLELGDGPDSSSYLESVAWQAEQDLPNARVAINIPINALPRFLKTGSYIPATESGVGTSSGRAEQELKRGYRTADEQPLVYGYLTTTDASTAEQPEVFGYGGAIVRLTPEKTADSTFTSSDSMDMGMTKDSLRSLYDALLIEESRRLRAQTGAIGSKTRYVESQIHGGVATSNIESLSVPLDVSEKTTGEALAETIAMLETELPNAERIVRVDATDSLANAARVLELAQQYPGTKIELVVRPSNAGGDTDPRQAPFIGNKDGMRPELAVAHDRMETRFNDLSAKLNSFAQKSGLSALPDNISVQKGVYDRSFSARKESHDPAGLISKQVA